MRIELFREYYDRSFDRYVKVLGINEKTKSCECEITESTYSPSGVWTGDIIYNEELSFNDFSGFEPLHYGGII